MAHEDELEAALEKSEQRRKALGIALLEISKGEGPFSMDRLTHATNVIDKAVRIAGDAIRADREAAK